LCAWITPFTRAGDENRNIFIRSDLAAWPMASRNGCAESSGRTINLCDMAFTGCWRPQGSARGSKVGWRRRLGKLHAVEIGVRATSGHQRIVRALFGHDAVFDDHDLARVANGAEPVGYGNDRPSLHQPHQRFDDEALRFRVERGRGLVEDENW